MGKISQGSTFTAVNSSDIKGLKITVPTSLSEQEKIADFLSYVDENIESLEDKLKLMEKYRKGVMQKIFSEELRFKNYGGNEYLEWKEVKLGDILSLTLREVAKPQTAYGALGVRSHAKGTFHKEVEDPTTVAMDKLYQVKKDDFIVSITFAWEHAIAICTAEDEGRLVSHRFPTYRAKENLDINFFRYVIIQKRFKYLLDLISPGGAGRNRVLSKPSLLKLKITIPCLEEQKKIADFLSSIDKEIKVLEEEVKGNKSFKKGLLQQMFV
jgi:type I restriction enzyme S subunit